MGGDQVGDEEEDDNGEGLEDVQDEMSMDEIATLDKSLQPVRLVLVKVNSDSDSTNNGRTYNVCWL